MAVEIDRLRAEALERGRTAWETQMNRLGVAGALWLVAATFSVATTLIFRTDPVQWVVTIVVGLISAVLGLWLIARPKALVVFASGGIAVAWIVLYAVLAVQQSGDLRHGLRTPP